MTKVVVKRRTRSYGCCKWGYQTSRPVGRVLGTKAEIDFPLRREESDVHPNYVETRKTTI